MLVARYLSSGALDPSFGAGGVQRVDFGGRSDQANALAVQSDGKIILAGHSGGAIAVARLAADGRSLDTSFGDNGDGEEVVPVSSLGSDAADVAIDGDGRIVVAGTSKTNSGGDYAVLRLTSGGRPDPDFGSGGVVKTDVRFNDDVAAGLAIQDDGKIVVAGHSGTDTAVTRYLSSGGGGGGGGGGGSGVHVDGFSEVATPRRGSVSTISVGFTENVNIYSFTTSDLTLTRDGKPVSLNVLLLPLDVNPYDFYQQYFFIFNLDSETSPEGFYELSVDSAGVLDSSGHHGVGTQSLSFVVDKTGPRPDVVPVAPSPRNTPVDEVDVAFSEPTTGGFTVGDLTLTRDGQKVPLDGVQVAGDGQKQRYAITGLAALTAAQGVYKLTADGSGIKDKLGNVGGGTASTTFTVDTERPRAVIAPVVPSPRTAPVDEVHVDVVQGDAGDPEPDVRGVATDALHLTREGRPVDQLAAVTVEADPINGGYAIRSLGSATAAPGLYVLSIDNTKISDAAGNAGVGSTAVSFVVDAEGPPRVTAIADVTPSLRNEPVVAVAVTLSEPVDPSSFDAADLGLTRDGRPVPLDGVRVVRDGDATYRIEGLAAATGTDGDYVLTVDAAGLDDRAGNPGAGSASTSFTVDRTGPTVATLGPIDPDPRRDPLDTVDLAFSEPIDPSTLDAADLGLTRDGEAVALPAGLTIAPVDGRPATYRVAGLAAATGAPGRYVLSVDAAGVRDPAGNPGVGTRDGSFVVRTEPPAGDYSGDGQTNLALYRYDPSTGQGVFSIRRPDGTAMQVTIDHLSAHDVPVSGDFDGDGIVDAAVVEPLAKLNGSSDPNASVWVIRQSSDGAIRTVPFGGAGTLDRPAPADYDGDGKTDIATFRASSDITPGAAEWFILPSGGGPAFRVAFGAAGGGDLPAPADYDGDGRADIATFRPVPTAQDLARGISGVAQWFILPSMRNDPTFSERAGGFPIVFGASGNADQPIVADYNGDGRADIAAFRSVSDLAAGHAQAFILPSSGAAPGFGSGYPVTLGAAGSIAAVADYDGDGRPDYAVYDPGASSWTIEPAGPSGMPAGSPRVVAFGAAGDVPVLAPLYFRLLATDNVGGSATAAERSVGDLHRRLTDAAIEELAPVA